MVEKVARPALRVRGRATSTNSLSDSAYRKLRDAIRDGTLTHGARVMEVEIADWLKMSRTPVRDALRRLEADGIVTHEPRNGLVVSRLDRQAISELYVMRENLEGIAARLCSQNAPDLTLDHLKYLIEDERKLQGDHEALIKRNYQFHDAIRSGANNRYLLRSLATVVDTMYMIGGHTQAFLPSRSKEILVEHTKIVAAIAKRDATVAEQAAREHVRAGQRARMKMLFAEFGS